jgi:uncharacterized membrane protein YhaH (DUF805 family)
MRPGEFSFLFRQSEGGISASVWRRWTLALTGLCLAMAAIWQAVAPFTRRDLAAQGLFDIGAFLAFAYLIFFAFALLLTQICQYNLSAKRFRARRRPAEWAAFWPLAAFAAGASFWAQPNLFGLMPAFVPWLLLALAFGLFVAIFVELGFRPA